MLDGPLNQQPAPTAPPVAYETPRPVWVDCTWDYHGGRVNDSIPATATHHAHDLVLCIFWDPRADGRDHWMLADAVRDREVKPASPKGRATRAPR